MSFERRFFPEDKMKTIQENWKRYCAGDNSALGGLYDEMIAPLQYTAYHYTKDWKQAEDMAGDLFLMLVESSIEQRSNWVTKNDCLSFLKVVIQYKSIDWVRKQANHHRIHQLIDWPVLENPQLSDEQLKSYALSLLNEKEKQLLTAVISGISMQELSVQNDVSEKTIRNNLSLIRLKLNRIKNLIPFLFP
ncbi:MAG: hypothetical protein RL609_1472 [Bacteroidota bacterium]|jgi:DNA-directed RNA polymerase specialized sigma24 family protein